MRGQEAGPDNDRVKNNSVIKIGKERCPYDGQLYASNKKEGDVMKYRELSVSVMLLVFCVCLTLLTQAGLAGAQSAERAAEKGRIVIQPGKDGTNTIILRCMEGKCPTCPLQLTPGKYGLMVTGIERKGVQVVVSELKNERGKEVFRGEPDNELGPINLKEGISYGVYIGKKDVSSAKSARLLDRNRQNHSMPACLH